MLELPLVEGTYDYGDAFEHFIIMEIKRLCDYSQPDWTLAYLRTKDDAEIDLIIERPGQTTVAIEIKSTRQLDKIKDRSFHTFKNLIKDIPNCKAYIFSQDPFAQLIDGIECLPWQQGFKSIGLLD